MFDSVGAKWIGSGQADRRQLAILITLDRPDLMADAGYDGLMYHGSGSRSDTRNGNGRHAGDRWAMWRMPFHAAAG